MRNKTGQLKVIIFLCGFEVRFSKYETKSVSYLSSVVKVKLSTAITHTSLCRPTFRIVNIVTE